MSSVTAPQMHRRTVSAQLDQDAQNGVPVSVEAFLKDAQLDKLIEVFSKHEIDSESLLELTEKDLMEMGILVGPKLKIMSRLRKLKGIAGSDSPRDARLAKTASVDAEILSSSLGIVKEGGTKVVILIGGPSKGTRFRPLSMETPKPLFPIAGKPLIWHHLKAATRLPDLSEVVLIGFYDITDIWKQFIVDSEKELGISIRYLKEHTGRLGTAGGLQFFKAQIMEGKPEHLIVVHCDICCSFPFKELLHFHIQNGKECTILGKKVPQAEAHKYGCLAYDQNTNEVLHYAEKPETFVSDMINAGVYVFSPSIYNLIDRVAAIPHPKSITEHPDYDPNFLQLEQHLFANICGEKHVYVYETKDFWLQIKSAGVVVKCSEDLLAQLREQNPHILARNGDGKATPTIVGNCLIHPTAKVHPTAKIGPNVSIGADVVVGEGVRIKHSIILDKATIKEHACIQYTIVGWYCNVGKWTRLEGRPNYYVDIPGITILGTGVTVASEIVVNSSVILPHKDLGSDTKNQIIL